MSTHQLSLLDHQLMGAPHNNTETSIAAAMSAGLKQGDRKGRILRWIAFCGESGATQAELCDALFIKRQSMTAPVNALVKEGQIRKLDGVTRMSTDGGECAVYVLGGGMPDEDDPAVRLVAGETKTSVPDEEAGRTS